MRRGGGREGEERNSDDRLLVRGVLVVFAIVQHLRYDCYFGVYLLVIFLRR